MPVTTVSTPMFMQPFNDVIHLARMGNDYDEVSVHGNDLVLTYTTRAGFDRTFKFPVPHGFDATVDDEGTVTVSPVGDAMDEGEIGWALFESVVKYKGNVYGRRTSTYEMFYISTYHDFKLLSPALRQLHPYLVQFRTKDGVIEVTKVSGPS